MGNITVLCFSTSQHPVAFRSVVKVTTQVTKKPITYAGGQRSAKLDKNVSKEVKYV